MKVDKRIGNQFWQLSKREKKFSTPEKLWKASCDYFQWCADNPIIEKKVLSNGTVANAEKPRPFTLEGLLLRIGLSKGSWHNYSSQIQWSKYHPVCEAIETIITEQQYSLAVVGLYRADIVSRKLGLVDKTEHTIKPKKDGNLSNLTDDELEQFRLLTDKMQNEQITVIPGAIQAETIQVYNAAEGSEPLTTGESTNTIDGSENH